MGSSWLQRFLFFAIPLSLRAAAATRPLEFKFFSDVPKVSVQLPKACKRQLIFESQISGSSSLIAALDIRCDARSAANAIGIGLHSACLDSHRLLS